MIPYFFDLDGTLADSVGGISESLVHATRSCGVGAEISDWRPFIGPPLESMLTQAIPELTNVALAKVMAAFRRHYDTTGLLRTTLFPGVRSVLETLACRGERIFIVTNKPQKAADAIVRNLGLIPLIRRVCGAEGDCVDLKRGKCRKKADRVALIAKQEQLHGGIFVGDGVEDLESAERIGATFYLAEWGYGVKEVIIQCPNVRCVKAVNDLLGLISISSPLELR
jgi:phosphoglycolate phosphatase